MTSNVRDLVPGQGNMGLLLNAQGHMLAELETLACEDRLLALGHMQVREKTEETLEKFIIMDDVTLTDETAESGTVAIEGPHAPAMVHELANIDLSALPARGLARFQRRGISTRLRLSGTFPRAWRRRRGNLLPGDSQFAVRFSGR